MNRKWSLDFLAFVFLKVNRISNTMHLTTDIIELIEIIASHSTPSFIFGWKTSSGLTNMEILRLKDKPYNTYATCLQIKP